MLRELVLGTVLAAALFVLIGAAGFCVAVGRFRTTTTTATGIALATLGVSGWATFWAYLASPALGRAVTGTVLAAAAGTLAIVCRRSGETRAALRSAMPTAGMAAGIALVTLALIGLWGIDRNPFELARIRFSHYLPVDNEIPELFLRKLAAGQDPRNILKPWWQSSDRPPLQTGLMLIAYPFTRALGLQPDISGLSSGIACELAWIPALAALIRSIGGRQRGVLAGLLFTGITGTVLVNTVYTWPKLLSAAFVLAAVAVLLQPVTHGARVNSALFALTGLLVALGMLSHGAALFALPIPMLVLASRYRLVRLRSLGAMVAVAVVAYLPWMLYQRLYDPPGTALLSLHLAAIQPRPGDGGVPQEVLHHYQAIGLHATLANKWANVVRPFDMPPWQGLSLHGVNIIDLRIAQFFTLSAAIGIGWVAALVVLVAFVVARLRRERHDSYASWVLLLVAFGLVSVIVWALVMFGPGTTYLHQGSHVFVLIALGAPIAWLVDRMPRSGTTILLLGVAFGGATAVPFMRYEATPGHLLPLSRPALLVGAAGVLLVVTVFTAHARLRSSRIAITGMAPQSLEE